jgi:fructose/tagatose bisphosphate aldolase
MSLNPEQIHHINVVNWFTHNYPDLADDFHHFANERKCSMQQGRLLKRMGVKKGVADFFLALAIGGFHGLWIELKTEKGKLTPEQLEFLMRKRQRGYSARVAHGSDEAKEAILDYLDNHITNSFYNIPKNCT